MEIFCHPLEAWMGTQSCWKAPCAPSFISKLQRWEFAGVWPTFQETSYGKEEKRRKKKWNDIKAEGCRDKSTGLAVETAIFSSSHCQYWREDKQRLRVLCVPWAYFAQWLQSSGVGPAAILLTQRHQGRLWYFIPPRQWSQPFHLVPILLRRTGFAPSAFVTHLPSWPLERLPQLRLFSFLLPSDPTRLAPSVNKQENNHWSNFISFSQSLAARRTGAWLEFLCSNT